MAEETCWKMVGVNYVHGLMDEEVMEEVKMERVRCRSLRCTE